MNETKAFFCRGCGREEPAEGGAAIPTGWLVLARKLGAEFRDQRLGLYCSFECVGLQLPRLISQQQDLGERWLAVARSRAGSFFRRAG